MLRMARRARLRPTGSPPASTAATCCGRAAPRRSRSGPCGVHAVERLAAATGLYAGRHRPPAVAAGPEPRRSRPCPATAAAARGTELRFRREWRTARGDARHHRSSRSRSGDDPAAWAALGFTVGDGRRRAVGAVRRAPGRRRRRARSGPRRLDAGRARRRRRAATSTACPPAAPIRRRRPPGAGVAAPQRRDLGHRPPRRPHPRPRPHHRGARRPPASRPAAPARPGGGRPQRFFRLGEVVLELVGPTDPARRRAGHVLRPGLHGGRPRRHRRPPGRPHRRPQGRGPAGPAHRHAAHRRRACRCRSR